MKNNKKTYEVPALSITELETGDIMLISGLIGWDILSKGEELGYGTIEVDFE